MAAKKKSAPPSTTPAAGSPPAGPTPCPAATTGGIKWEKQPGATDEDLKKAQDMWEEAKKRRLPDGSKPDTVKAMEALECSDKTTTIKVGADGNDATPDSHADGMDPAKGTNTVINFNPDKKGNMGDGVERDPESSLAHEAFHAYENNSGKRRATREEREVAATAAENQHRAAKGLPQRSKYGSWDVPQYTPPP